MPSNSMMKLNARPLAISMSRGRQTRRATGETGERPVHAEWREYLLLHVAGKRHAAYDFNQTCQNCVVRVEVVERHAGQ